MNISFVKLGEEECEDCIMYENHEHGNLEEGNAVENCDSWKAHVERANVSRKLYKEDAGLEPTPSKAYFSVDMQKAIMLLRIPGVKKAVFTNRLVTFHETFAPFGRFSKTKGIVPTGGNMAWRNLGSKRRRCSQYIWKKSFEVLNTKAQNILYFGVIIVQGKIKIWSFSPCSVICWMSMAAQNQVPLNILKKVTHSWLLTHSNTKLKKKWGQRKMFTTSTILRKSSNQKAVCYPRRREISMIGKMGSVKESLHYPSLYYVVSKLLC